MTAGIPAEHISLSSQELPADFAELIDQGVKVNAW
jgi:diaminopimelate decarboxylase